MPDVPAIPEHALAAVSDPNAAIVLRALISGWYVRNGDTGQGAQRFVTAEEVGLAKGKSGGIPGRGLPGFSGGNSGVSPADVSRIINAAEALVLESPLFIELGTRFDLLDVPGGPVAVAGAAILASDTMRFNGDNALAEAINTMWAAVGDSDAIIEQGGQVVANRAGAVATNWAQTQAAIRDPDGNIVSSAAVRTAAEAAVSITGEINAKYTVKVDVNGYVSGYGLISTANNGTPTSDFTVRADRFAVGSPSGPGIAPQVPFIVYTTPQVIGGQAVPAGVYMREAFIANGTIDSARIANAAITTAKIADANITRAKIGSAAIGYANIGDAEVNTLKIAGNAVTLMASAYAGFYGASTIEAAVSVLLYGGPVFLCMTGQSSIAGGIGVEIYRDGSLLTSGSSGSATDPCVMAITWVDYPGSGWHTYTFLVASPLPSSVNGVVLETRR
jgi:hypothetical protein